MDARQDSDNFPWDRSDECWEEAIKQVRLSSTCRRIESFAQRLLGDTATLALPLLIGGFNVLYPIRYKGSYDSDSSPMANYLVRLPCPNHTAFREEKTLAEAATTVFVSQRTQLPVPTLHSSGVDLAIGPFIILQDLGTLRGMGEALEALREDPSDTPILNPNIFESKFKSLYRHIAACLLQLAQPTFPCIGALVETESGSFSVPGRPITLNVKYEDDCKTKYVAHQLFRRLAKQGRLSKFEFADDTCSASSEQTRTNLPAPDISASFHLWSDDFRPNNILISENDEILGAIDWEFTYAAPTQFSLDPPWWLLLDVPEMWDAGIDDWATLYERRLQTWLSALVEAEQDMARARRFWLNYAARKSWAFDKIYWKYLDERFFGEREKDTPTASELWKTRIHLLTPEERSAMERMVQRKTEEAKFRVLVKWEDVEARELLSSFLFD
ncbi:phosphotransferase [Drepanopeziza brunnea f. sp. 'multigermtubi' MB_m1]|uniref:Phosphotransferase n=1 Tax=Marssonina brunnea f. sp. multigermtubi (strain MB_m1) TaxID=1072389 RepID=K1WTA7_MARBU|nr:phosphotransferase [Drepanopeziza brunnea f. sp. 'multigermtubi' MB_m1]EKD15632.1 phosphotransferase [Drepanopeziza brunnea f. sp. 'multigermtubi' MB_m1]